MAEFLGFISEARTWMFSWEEAGYTFLLAIIGLDEDNLVWDVSVDPDDERRFAEAAFGAQWPDRGPLRWSGELACAMPSEALVLARQTVHEDLKALGLAIEGQE